ncbi:MULTISPECIES: hypothetical protein [unclassified Streptomyces]|uniref:hypothetical protein n=1 Tax=unclassified Streptomyces TaxID=2593676 RepID=UPI0018F89D53|nr:MULTISPECIES: hypothetical protein [unclassified Streptomyces]
MRKSMKLYALGAAVAAALTVTACGSGDGDGKAGESASPSASVSSSPSAQASPSSGTSSKPAPAKTGTTVPAASADGKGGGDDWDYADRQVPPSGSVCDHGGQGPYGSVESVNWGGESPYPVMGLVLGHYECGDTGPNFVPSSATGAASNVFVDSHHLKVVVGGKLASDLGTRTPKPDKFLDQLALMQDKGQLGGPKAPQFYFRIDASSDDVNAMPDDDSHLIYLYQIVDGD